MSIRSKNSITPKQGISITNTQVSK